MATVAWRIFIGASVASTSNVIAVPEEPPRVCADGTI